MKHESMKVLLKKEKGITLIALVITIVILIILAGTLINITLGNNGLFTRAKTAAEKMQKVQVIELAQTDILSQIVENNGNEISKAQLHTILEKYFDDVPDFTDMTDEEMLDLNLTAKSKYGSVVIKLSEIYNGKTTGNASVEVDWEQAKANATQPHPSQTGNNDIGIGTDGNLVNLDLWNYGTQYLRYNETSGINEKIDCASNEFILYGIDSSREIIPRI